MGMECMTLSPACEAHPNPTHESATCVACGLERLNVAFHVDRSDMGRVDAVARFVLEVVRPALVSDGDPELLGSVPDEVECFGKFSHIGVLRRVFESGGDVGSVDEVVHPGEGGFSAAGDHGAAPVSWGSLNVPEVRG